MPQLADMALGPRFAACLFALASIGFALSGCAGDPADEEGEPVTEGGGDGTGGEDEIVSERQLMGNELADKTVSLTFDDGPGPRTAELAEFLASKGIRAAFFINGKNVPGRQAAIDAIVGRGHLLANHTQNHLQLTKLSSDKVASEVTETDAIVVRAQPRGPFVLRAPFGAWNAATTRAVNGTAMKKYAGSVFWDIGGQLTQTAAADWDCWGRGVGVQRCGELYMNEIRTRKRGIVLMHDVHSKTVDMVKTVVVPTLVAEGYTFAKLEDVPSVKRAIGAAGAAEDGCFSATLGTNVVEGTCVESRRDRKWYRCVDGEWAASAGAGDAKCVKRVALSP
jgi:peptidoglycan/xylan/chitin deacetylase (PgdA/CDA1 family)